MIKLKDKACAYCGEPACNVYGHDDLDLFCCVECTVELDVFSALPYYEYANNSELQLAKASTYRDYLLNL